MVGVTCVRSLVALELIGTCEALAAKGPAADEGPLARVPAEVSPQMRCLAVYLSTAGDVTYVLLLFSWVAKVKNKTKSQLQSCGRSLHGDLKTKIWMHGGQRRSLKVICSSGLLKRLHGVEPGKLCVKGRGRKLVQRHTVLLRPCRRGTCRLPDGCVFLEEVGSYRPRL